MRGGLLEELLTLDLRLYLSLDKWQNGLVEVCAHESMKSVSDVAWQKGCEKGWRGTHSTRS